MSGEYHVYRHCRSSGTGASTLAHSGVHSDVSRSSGTSTPSTGTVSPPVSSVAPALPVSVQKPETFAGNGRPLSAFRLPRVERGRHHPTYTKQIIIRNRLLSATPTVRSDARRGVVLAVWDVRFGDCADDRTLSTESAAGAGRPSVSEIVEKSRRRTDFGRSVEPTHLENRIPGVSRRLSPRSRPAWVSTAISRRHRRTVATNSPFDDYLFLYNTKFISEEYHYETGTGSATEADASPTTRCTTCHVCAPTLENSIPSKWKR